MTREEIVAKRKELDQKRKDLEKAQKLLRVEFEMLFIECEHPNARSYQDRDGSSSTSCPDCGWSN